MDYQQVNAWGDADTQDYNTHYAEYKQAEARKHRVRIVLGTLAGLVILLLAVALAYMVGHQPTPQTVHDAPLAAPAPAVVPPPPPPPVASPPVRSEMGPDERFLVALDGFGITTPNAQRTVQIGHQLCQMLASGQTENEVEQALLEQNPGLQNSGAQFFVTSAEKILCTSGA